MDMLWGMFPEELKALMLTWGEPGFRGKQLFRDLQKGLDFDGMTVLSKPLRERLKAEMPAPPVTVLEEHASREDGTVKLLYGLSDRNCVEGVLMRYHYGVTLCVSTQVGCAMGCLFCASTLDGCVRNLTAAEMVKAYNAENGEGSLVILSEAMTTEPYAFALTLGSDDLAAEINKIINEMVSDGSIAAIFEKYDAPYTAPHN